MQPRWRLGCTLPCVEWVSAVAFGVTWWLGLYLPARDPRKPLLRRAGAGLLAYACAVVADRMAGGSEWFDGVRIVLVCVPALAWSGVFVRLLPPRYVERIDCWWRFGLIPLCVVVAMPAATGLLPAGYVLGALTLLALLGTMLGVLGQQTDWSEDSRRPVAGLLTVGALLYGLNAALILLGTNVLPQTAMLAAMALELVVLGLGVAKLDAFEEGEALRVDLIRSLLAATATGVVFGAPAAIASIVVGGHAGGQAIPEQRGALTAVLFGALAAAIAMQVLNAPLQAGVDRLAFAATPRLRALRGELREATEALPRKDTHIALSELGDNEFDRLTRSALGHYGDLGKLVSSPLVDLPAVDARLAGHAGEPGPLDRAAELQALLSEGITLLKPDADAEFGTGEEWQDYNAAYFGYVVGLRPYGGRTKRACLDPVARRALDWFAAEVPERHLRAWQESAAKRVAAHLRSVSAAVSS